MLDKHTECIYLKARIFYLYIYLKILNIDKSHVNACIRVATEMF